MRIRVRLTPKASRNAVCGLRQTAAGATQLLVKVTAPADKGRANAALMALLAKNWKIAPGRLRLLAGATDRNKVLHLGGPPAETWQRLESWAAGLTTEAGVAKE